MGDFLFGNLLPGSDWKDVFQPHELYNSLFGDKQNTTVTAPRMSQKYRGLADQTLDYWNAYQQEAWRRMMGGAPSTGGTGLPSAPVNDPNNLPVKDPNDPNDPWKPPLDREPTVPGGYADASSQGATPTNSGGMNLGSLLAGLFGGTPKLSAGPGSAAPGGAQIAGGAPSEGLSIGYPDVGPEPVNEPGPLPGIPFGGTTQPISGAHTALIPWISDTNWNDPATIWDPAVRPTAGTNVLLDQAVKGAWDLGNMPAELQQALGLIGDMRDVGSRRVTGEGLEKDPAVIAAQQLFDSATRPLIETEAANMGLGRSTALTNALAARKAATLMPTIQDYFGREERGIDRELGTLGNMFQGLLGLGDRTQSRKGESINTFASLGDYGRQIGQDKADSSYNDWLRRAGQFENAMSGPFGLVGSTVGSQTTSNKKQQS